MIKRIDSELKIMSFILVIFITIIITGILAYKGFSSIVGEVSRSSEPETKIVLVKQIVSDILEAENNVKSYNLTRDIKYLSPFYNSVLVIDKNINELKRLTKNNSAQSDMALRMEALIDQKYTVLNKLLTLYPDENITNELIKISKQVKEEKESINESKDIEGNKLETTPPKEKTFFQRLFGKSDKKPAIDSVNINSNEVKEQKEQKKNILFQSKINSEIEKVNRQHVYERKLVKEKEFRLANSSASFMLQIRQMSVGIEKIERSIISGKINRATQLAKEAKNLVAIFCFTASLLLVIVSFVLGKYVLSKRAHEKVLKDGKDQAENLAKSKELFLANMSHEIRTPMNAIAGFTNQILKTELNTEQRDQLKIVQKSNEHLLRIINDILDYSKIQAGKFSFEYVSFNPDKIMREAIQLLAPLIKNKKVTINYNVRERIPEFVVGDPGRLKQILLNLLSNSIKFTNEGKINITVDFKNNLEGSSTLNLRISDTGIGIPEGKINEVFSEFHQADNNISYKYGGTGLGLPITKKLVELQNGSIEIESKDGRGTTITIHIPYNESIGNELFYKESGKPVDADKLQLKDLKVLIADDDEYNRKLLNVILRKWKAEVREACNGKEVMEELKKSPFDILLMDIRMPEMSGIEAAEQIRKLKDTVKAETPIIALTAVTTEEKKQRCINAGINDFLSKPFKEEELYKKIVGLIGLSNVDISENNKQFENNLPMKNESNKSFSLEELKQVSNGDEKFVTEMIAIFIKTTEAGLNQIETGLKQNNLKIVAESAHKIIPPCRHMGADELLSNLVSVESAARSNDKNVDLTELVRRAKQNADIVINDLKKEIS